MCITEPLEARGGGGGGVIQCQGWMGGENWNAVCKLN